ALAAPTASDRTPRAPAGTTDPPSQLTALAPSRKQAPPAPSPVPAAEIRKLDSDPSSLPSVVPSAERRSLPSPVRSACLLPAPCGRRAHIYCADPLSGFPG